MDLKQLVKQHNDHLMKEYGTLTPDPETMDSEDLITSANLEAAQADARVAAVNEAAGKELDDLPIERLRQLAEWEYASQNQKRNQATLAVRAEEFLAQNPKYKDTVRNSARLRNYLEKLVPRGQLATVAQFQAAHDDLAASGLLE